MAPPRILLTGAPGSGKTTVVRAVVLPLAGGRDPDPRKSAGPPGVAWRAAVFELG